MGGYVFGVVARRLTTVQHNALFQYAKARLHPFTKFAISCPRTADDKTTHGDVDILMGNWAEGQGFKYNFAVDDANAERCDPLTSTRWCEVGSTPGYQWSCAEVRSWAKAVAITLGARSWQNHQHGVSLAMPCHVIGDLVPNHRAGEVS